jgi:hypothetical protein
MKNIYTKIGLVVVLGFIMLEAVAQNVSVNILTLNSGIIPIGGTGTLQATINATTGSGGQNTPVPAGRLNLQISVPSTLNIAASQNSLPAGWIVRNNNGSVLNLCNSSSTIAVGSAVDLLIALEGVSATTGTPIIVGQITFRNNCTAPGGAIAGDNPADNSSTAGFTVTGTVPVKLTNFIASLSHCKPNLQWTTEQEIGFAKFEIEKSADSYSWTTIGAVAAANNTLPKNDYRFTDNEATIAERKVFYRLKMIDRDGRYRYSFVLPVINSCTTENFQVFPNPVKGNQFYIIINTPNASQTTALLINAAGQVVKQNRLTNGTNTFAADQLAAGAYLLKVIHGNGKQTLTKILIEQ